MGVATCFGPSEPENRSNIFAIWCERALREARVKDFHWHDLRHTFASRLRMKGTPLEDIADLLGHRRLVMTNLYAHRRPSHLQH